MQTYRPGLSEALFVVTCFSLSLPLPAPHASLVRSLPPPSSAPSSQPADVHNFSRPRLFSSKGDPVPSPCAKTRQAYESDCPASWVVHFDQTYSHNKAVSQFLEEKVRVKRQE